MNGQTRNVCLIEDDEIMGEALADRLALEGYDCDWFKTGAEGRKALGAKRYGAAICDINLPDINGEDLFLKLSEIERAVPFVFITGYGTIDAAVRLLKLGASDYLTKPLDIHALLDALRRLCGQVPFPAPAEYVLGISSAMRQIEAMLPQLASSASSVLITGESGVGKEEVARALHRQRDPGGHLPFVAVNCGALTESLMEAELFGYVKGAFTGANRDKKGVFEQAEGGTLFLDEIGEMSPLMQVKLLRAIQDRQIMRVGAERPISVSLNLICATHQNLKSMVETGRFREDLYYRIHVVHLHIPPLRERKDDILWLARRLLGILCAGKPVRRQLHPSGEKALLDHAWPGNVRELKHCLERACVLHPDGPLTGRDLFGNLQSVAQPAQNASVTLSGYLGAREMEYIEQALAANDGRIADTAAALGISRKNLWEKMKKLGIQEKPATHDD
ncbi:MAG TPA: sigma-54 dependent transcriptional regulator [Rhodocyclaceae bacterium]|nr:sigma-54 dependent transcriptional regulator [Rhodocyclaceae bacterium]